MEDNILGVSMDLPTILSRVPEVAGEFERRIRDIPYEDKGMLFSDMLLLYAAVRSGCDRLARIVESGRARGQSTLILARCFPDSMIVSVDCDHESEDVVFGERRLRGLSNVELLCGDAKELLPRLVQRGDVVLIDGPKSFRALHLALTLLATDDPSIVFIHDFYRGLPERDMLERHVPEAFFSDDPEFVARCSYLDKPCWDTIRAKQLEGWQPYEFLGRKQASYGPTLACLPKNPAQAYVQLAARVLSDALSIRAEYVRRSRGRPRTER
jgi:predicted O-methyltransferase YrrM